MQFVCVVMCVCVRVRVCMCVCVCVCGCVPMFKYHHRCYSLSFLQGSQDDSSKLQVTKLKRRFLKDRTGDSSFFAKRELRKKFVRQVS